MKHSGHRKLLCELSKCNAFNLLLYLTNTDASILVYKFRPERTGFNMYAEYKQHAINFCCITFMLNTNKWLNGKLNFFKDHIDMI